MITDKPGMFQNGKTYDETGLSDSHKYVVIIMKLSCKKRPPRMIKYRNHKKFSNEHFKNFLNENLANNTELSYNGFEEIVPNIIFSGTILKKEWFGQIKVYL